MADEDKWRWEFFGFESESEGRPVQVWFDRLDIEVAEEITDLIQKLRVVTASRWRKPEFDPLIGEGGISEIRFDYKSLDGLVNYRIYGCRGLPHEHAYLFLHPVTGKVVKNDQPNKDIAKDRLARFRREEATAHEFDFEGRYYSATEEESRG